MATENATSTGPPHLSPSQPLPPACQYLSSLSATAGYCGVLNLQPGQEYEILDADVIKDGGGDAAAYRDNLNEGGPHRNQTGSRAHD